MTGNKFIPSKPLNTAVLFIVFNRMDTTKQVFEAIQKAKPPKLYIASDGARKSITGEHKKVESIRDFVTTNINWDCEVKTLFLYNNLGCKYAVSDAISWFFENEEMGIILEDDCLPSQSFFWFCEELLVRYKDNMDIGMISGDNFQKGIKKGNADYFFSVYSHIWGWASWANRWKNYDVELTSMHDAKFIKKIFKNYETKKYWIKVFKKMKDNEIDTWDYQWTFCLWNKSQLSIMPNVNLIENIGFGADATHTTGESELANLKTSDIYLNSHPATVSIDHEADIFASKNTFGICSFLDKKIIKISKMKIKFKKLLQREKKC